MPGVIYRAVPKTTYDFSSLPASSRVSLWIAKAIDVSGYREAEMAIRVHAASISGAPSISLEAWPEGPTSEDPSQDFIGQNAFASSGTMTLSSSGPTFYGIVPLTPSFGSHLRIKLGANQPSSASTTFQISLSVDIVAKS
jgi:hypothetical protein